ncbi:MAG: CoA transferase [Acidimicrobiia bacterium]|nr:CoA transferase [Acidimicrobiia bacterium]
MLDGPRGPLQGVRVIDVTQAIAGPWCTMMLGDLGADVIKVEPPAGDSQRFLGPYTKDDEERAYGGAYATYNRNKRGIVLDLSQEADKATLLRLVDGADALVENSRAGVLDRLGLGYEVLHARNPRLVYGAVRGFGDPRSGASPYGEWPAYDVVAQAMGTLVSMNGTASGEELKVGPFVGDIYPGTVAAVAMVAALFHARATGEGQFVDVGMVDAIMALSEFGVMRWSYMGRTTPPTGNQAPFSAPFDIFATKDGSAAIAAPGDHQWATFCQCIGREDLIADPRCAKARERVRNRDFVDEVVGGWAAERTTAEIVEVLGGLVPVGPVRKPAELIDDPHAAARQMLVAVPQPSARPTVQVNTPMRFSATPAGVHRRAPRLDEHGEEVRAELDQLHD